MASIIIIFITGVRGEVYTVLSSSKIQTKSIYSRVIKSKNWDDLKRIEVKYIKNKSRTFYPDSYFICLIFSDDMKLPDTWDAFEDENLITVAYTEKRLSLINKYTNIYVDTSLLPKKNKG